MRVISTIATAVAVGLVVGTTVDAANFALTGHARLVRFDGAVPEETSVQIVEDLGLSPFGPVETRVTVVDRQGAQNSELGTLGRKDLNVSRIVRGKSATLLLTWSSGHYQLVCTGTNGPAGAAPAEWRRSELKASYKVKVAGAVSAQSFDVEGTVACNALGATGLTCSFHKDATIQADGTVVGGTLISTGEGSYTGGLGRKGWKYSSIRTDNATVYQCASPSLGPADDPVFPFGRLPVDGPTVR